MYALNLLVMHPDYLTAKAAESRRSQRQLFNDTRYVNERFDFDKVTDIKPALHDHHRPSGDVTKDHAECLAGDDNKNSTSTNGGNAASRDSTFVIRRRNYS